MKNLKVMALILTVTASQTSFAAGDSPTGALPSQYAFDSAQVVPTDSLNRREAVFFVSSGQGQDSLLHFEYCDYTINNCSQIGKQSSYRLRDLIAKGKKANRRGITEGIPSAIGCVVGVGYGFYKGAGWIDGGSTVVPFLLAGMGLGGIGGCVAGGIVGAGAGAMVGGASTDSANTLTSDILEGKKIQVENVRDFAHKLGKSLDE